MKKTVIMLMVVILLCAMLPVSNAEEKVKGEYCLWGLNFDMTPREAAEYLYNEKGIYMTIFSNGTGSQSAERVSIGGYGAYITHHTYGGDKDFQLSYNNGIHYNDNEMYKAIVGSLMTKYETVPDEAYISLCSDPMYWSMPQHADGPIYMKIEKLELNNADDILGFDIKQYAEEWEHITPKTDTTLILKMGNISISYTYKIDSDIVTLSIIYSEYITPYSKECGEFSKNVVTYEDTGF